MTALVPSYTAFATSEISARWGVLIDHRFEHLRCRDATLAGEAAFIDEHFLDLGKFFIGYFHAEVAARDHNAVCDVQDFIDVVHAAAALDFGNKVNIRVAVRLKEFADVDDVLCLGGERTGNKVDALLNAEQDYPFCPARSDIAG